MNTHFTKALVVALGLVVLSSCQPATSTTSQQSQSATLIDEGVYAGLPFEMERVKQPSFPDYQVNILDFGAKTVADRTD